MAINRETLINSGRTLLGALWDLFRRFWVVWMLVWISVKVQENYPFSHNPMYGRWDPYTYVLWVTDENDKILFFYNEFGQTAVKLKKIVKSREKLLEKEQPALTEEERYRISGEEALKHYHETRLPKVADPSGYETLKLWRADLVLEDNEVHKKDYVMATFTPKP